MTEQMMRALGEQLAAEEYLEAVAVEGRRVRLNEAGERHIRQVLVGVGEISERPVFVEAIGTTSLRVICDYAGGYVHAQFGHGDVGFHLAQYSVSAQCWTFAATAAPAAGARELAAVLEALECAGTPYVPHREDGPVFSRPREALEEPAAAEVVVPPAARPRLRLWPTVRRSVTAEGGLAL